MVTVRALLALAIHRNQSIQQLDVNNAFFHGDLNEEVYMSLPQGYNTYLPPGTVCKLRKSLYSLKQANRKYALDLLQQANVLNDKPSITPLNPVTSLNDTDGEPLTEQEASTYRTLVGKLIYLTIIRPDLYFAAQLLSQFSHQPRTPHQKALLRVLHYINLCPGQGLYFSMKNSIQMLAYCDSDWIACPITRRSLTCLFQDLQLQVNQPITILCDNASSRTLASNPVQHARTKHIEIDCHFVRDKIRDGKILSTYIPTKHQAADVLTKGLPKVLHFNFLLNATVLEDRLVILRVSVPLIVMPLSLVPCFLSSEGQLLEGLRGLTEWKCSY
ncbi:homogeneously-staining region [Tanacetum coccineum]|uniref:Homogeneously-staining region n=1 Tax=Tanacetum coccineum TaxID=301880 RepID=A0ABQ5CJN9_9ASTR